MLIGAYMKKVLFLLLAVMSVFSGALAQNDAQFQPGRVHEKNGQKIVKLTAADGTKNTYIYDKNNLLINHRFRNQSITYTYNSKNQLAYATTKKGAIYSIIRDRSGRISTIYGLHIWGMFGRLLRVVAPILQLMGA